MMESPDGLVADPADRAGAVVCDAPAAPDVTAEAVHGLMVGLLAALRALAAGEREAAA